MNDVQPANDLGSDLMNSLGLQRIVSSDPKGRVVMEFKVAPHHCHSVAQGGYVTAWLDAAMARAVGAATAGESGCNTLEIKVAFYRPALAGQVLLAEGWVERIGRSITFLETTLTNGEGIVVAKASSTAKLGRTRARSTEESDAR